MDISSFIFKYSQSFPQTAPVVALQVELAKKAKEKLPEHHEKGAIYSRRSFEQCSSEALALYKSKRFAGNRLLILAAGLGIDDWAFSKSFQHIVSIEPDNDLNDIALYNFDLMSIKRVKRLTCKAETYLYNNPESFDLIYIDPDRRNSNQRQILLRDHEPNVIELMPKLKELSQLILVKCSPLYDYEMALQELHEISEFFSVSKQGEMKEMLVLLQADASKKPIRVTCSDILSDKTISHTFELEDNAIPEPLTEFKNFLYEAGASLVKMRKHHCYAAFHKLEYIDLQVAFYCSDKPLENWLGRQFTLVKAMPYQSGPCKAYLHSKSIVKANVKSRGLKFKTEEVKRKLGLKDGGEDFIFILPYRGKAMFLHGLLTNSPL